MIRNCTGALATVYSVRGTPDLPSMRRYFVACDCEPRGHHAEIWRGDYSRLRRAGVALKSEDAHPWNGKRRVMTLDAWLRFRKARARKGRKKLTDLVAAQEKERVQKRRTPKSRKAPKSAGDHDPKAATCVCQKCLYGKSRGIPAAMFRHFDVLIPELKRLQVEFVELVCTYCGAWSVGHSETKPDGTRHRYTISCDKCKNGRADGRLFSRTGLFEAIGIAHEAFPDMDDPDIMRAAKQLRLLP